MKGLASLVLRGRLPAALVAAAAVLLALLLMPVLLLSGPALVVSAAVVVLVTLERGEREGLLTLAAAGLGVGALTLALFATVAPAVGVALQLWLPLWLLASVWRRTASLAWAVQAAAALGGVAVLVLYLAGYGEDEWRRMLNELAGPMLRDAGLFDNAALVDEVIRRLMLLRPGLMVANALAAVLAGLLLGRWWQTLLRSPGAFRREFHELRLGRTLALAGVLLLALALASGWPLPVNLALMLGVVYLLQGLALVHGALARLKAGWGWLALVYLLVLFTLPGSLGLLCLLALADAWVDLRARLRRARPAP